MVIITNYVAQALIDSRLIVENIIIVISLLVRPVPVNLPTTLFVGQLTQLQPFLDSISAVRK